MKALIAAIGMALMLGGQAFASGTSEEENTQKQKTENREILSLELDQLFSEGNLGETVVAPMYSSTDQLINTEILKRSTEIKD